MTSLPVDGVGYLPEVIELQSKIPGRKADIAKATCFVEGSAVGN